MELTIESRIVFEETGFWVFAGIWDGNCVAILDGTVILSAMELMDSGMESSGIEF